MYEDQLPNSAVIAAIAFTAGLVAGIASVFIFVAIFV
jgi:hypothetical protein